MLHRMRIYTVHLKPGYKSGFDIPMFVREGFNIWAFLFTGFWALYQRLWLVAGAVLAFNILVGWAQEEGYLSEASGFVLLLGAQIIMGFHGNDWIRDRLKRRGYITAGITAADSALRAQQRFFESYPGPAHSAA